MTPPLRSALALVAALAFPATVLAGEQTILPGYWESHNSVEGFAARTDLRCIAPKDIARVLAGPSNHIYRCDYPVSEAGGGRLRFAGRCVDKKGRAYAIRGDGEYTPTSLSMRAFISGRFLGLPLTIEASTRARRLSARCPAPEARSPAPGS